MPSIPIRFSMRTLLIATTAFAVWCTAVALVPSVFSQILVGILWLALTTFFAAGLLFAEGDQRAFCLGAILVVSSMWTGIGGQLMNAIHQLLSVWSPWSLWLDWVVIALTAVANGWFCVQARRYFQRES